MMPDTSDRAIIHVVDDDASMRAALESLFETIRLRTQSYATARDFLNASLPDVPGCDIIDVRLPEMNGLEFQARLTEMGVRLPVIMITGYGDIPMTVRAMRGGAIDFLPKRFRDQDKLDAVMTAIERDRRRAIESDMPQIQKRFETLSAREQEVTFLVTAGKMAFDGAVANLIECDPRRSQAVDSPFLDERSNQCSYLSKSTSLLHHSKSKFSTRSTI